MRISDWSSDVCSSDLRSDRLGRAASGEQADHRRDREKAGFARRTRRADGRPARQYVGGVGAPRARPRGARRADQARRSEEHTSELQSLMRISYAVFCLKKKKEQEKSRETSIAQRHQTAKNTAITIR